MILVSSCLLGICSKYDGTDNSCPILMECCIRGRFIPVCPEQLGGLPTPRPPFEIVGGTGEDVLAGQARVEDETGHDFTPQFIKGANEVLRIAGIFPVKAAILKQRSPSCGSSRIHDGGFNGRLITGSGVTAALLKKHGISVYSEEDLTDDMLQELTDK